MGTYNATFNFEQSCGYHSNQNKHIHCHGYYNFSRLHYMSEVKLIREFKNLIIDKAM